MSDRGRTQAFLKAARYSQPLNWLATSMLRGLLGPLNAIPGGLVRHLPRRGRVSARLPDGQMLLLESDADDWISNLVFWRGWRGYEPDTTPLFYAAARGASVVLDVGAHIGFHSLLAALANPSARIIAFEPHPLVQDRLRRHLEINRLQNVTLVAAAAGDRAGTGTLRVPGGGLPSSSTLSSGFPVSPSGYSELTVPVTTIDAFAGENALSGLDLVKIDTETTEPAVLRGMIECIRRFRPTIFFEVLPGFGTGPEIEEILAPFEYQYFHLGREGPIRRDRIVGESEGFNYVAAVSGSPHVSP